MPPDDWFERCGPEAGASWKFGRSRRDLGSAMTNLYRTRSVDSLDRRWRLDSPDGEDAQDSRPSEHRLVSRLHRPIECGIGKSKP